MQLIQNVHVDGFEITPNIISVGTRGSFGISKINFVFSSDWDNNSCKIVFHPLFGAPIEVIYTGKPIDVPVEIMKNSGIFEYVVSGVVRDESGVTKQISLPGKIKVLFTLDDEGRESAGFKPSALAQVLALIGDVKELDQFDANNIIEALKYLKVNGGTGGGGESGGGVNFTPGNALEITPDGILNVVTADEVEEDNTLPITSAAVAATVGNIEILLKTI